MSAVDLAVVVAGIVAVLAVLVAFITTSLGPRTPKRPGRPDRPADARAETMAPNRLGGDHSPPRT